MTLPNPHNLLNQDNQPKPIMKRLFYLALLLFTAQLLGQTPFPRVRSYDTLPLFLLSNPNDANTHVFVAGRNTLGDGGGGLFSIVVDDGNGTNSGTVFRFPMPYTNYLAKRELATGALNATWFGAKGDGVTDNAAVLQSMINTYQGTTNALYLPGGVYNISAPLTITNDLTLKGDGFQTVLQYAPLVQQTNLALLTVSNQIAIIGQQGMDIENLTLAGDNHSNIIYGLIVTNIGRSVFRNISAGNVSGAGFLVSFAVLSTFDNLQCNWRLPYFWNQNTSGFNVPPTNGLYSAYSGASACTLYNPVMEGCASYGIVLAGSTEAANIIGGASESNGGGLHVTEGAYMCTVIGLDCEADPTATLVTEANTWDNQFQHCILFGVNTIGGTGNRIYGGFVTNLTDVGLATEISFAHPPSTNGVGVGTHGNLYSIGVQQPGVGFNAPYFQAFGANTNWPLTLSALYDAGAVDQFIVLNGMLTDTNAKTSPTFFASTDGGTVLNDDRNVVNKGFNIGHLPSGYGGSPNWFFHVADNGGVTIGTNTTFSPLDLTLINANAVMDTEGKGLKIKEGPTSARMGQATLSAGAVGVSCSSVTSSTRIFLSYATGGGTLGSLYVSAIIAGSSFGIHSSSATDTNIVNWLLVEPAP